MKKYIQILSIALLFVLMGQDARSNINIEKAIQTSELSNKIEQMSKAEVEKEISVTLSLISKLQLQKDKSELVNQSIFLGDLYFKKNDFISSKKAYQQTEQYLEQKDFTNQAKLKLKIAIVLNAEGSLSESLKYALISEMLSKKSSDILIKVQSNRFLAKLYILYLDYDQSLVFANTTLNLMIKLNDTNEECKVYHQLASVYNLKSDFINGLKYYNLALDLAKKSKNDYSYARILIGLGAMMINQEKEKEALQYLIDALSLLKPKNDLLMATVCCMNLGIVYMNIDDYLNAEKFLVASLTYSEELKSKENMAFIYEQFGLLRFNQNQFDESITYFKKAIEFAELQKNDRYAVELKDFLLKIYKQKGNTNLAYMTLESIKTNLERVNQNDKKKVTELVKGKIEAESYIRDLELNNEIITKQKTVLTLILSLIILIAFFVLAFGTTWYITRRREKIQESKFNHAYSINEKIYDILHNDIIKTMLPITIHIHETTKTINPFIRDEYQKVTDKLNEILYEVNQY